MKLITLLIRLILTVTVVALTVVLTWRVAGGPSTDLVSAVRSGRLTDADWTLDRLTIGVACLLSLAAVAGLAAMVGLAATAVLCGNWAPRLAATCARATPAGLRRLVALSCGLGIVAPLAVAGTALGAPHARDLPHHQQSCHAGCHPSTLHLGGLELPDLPTPRQQMSQVVVRPGDSLWLIARHRLPPDATDNQIAALTARLATLNRSTIGADPDLIFPGMVLIAPEGRS